VKDFIIRQLFEIFDFKDEDIVHASMKMEENITKKPKKR